MEKALTSFTAFFANCASTCVSLLKVLLHLPYRRKIPAAAAEQCIILGNGPSFKRSLELYPGFFLKHPLFAVNSFATTDTYAQLKPAYYVILDPGFWNHSGKHVTDTLDALRSKTQWPMQLLLPMQARHSVHFKELAKSNPQIIITYFNYTVFKGFRSIAKFCFRRNLAMPQCQNVLAASIFLGINAGFKRIYIFGADHSWHETLYVNDENVVCVKHEHFYSEGKKTEYTPFYKGLHIRETFRMDEILYTFAKTFSGYRVLQDYALQRHCKIYNASEVSAIDAFERTKPQS